MTTVAHQAPWQRTKGELAWRTTPFGVVAASPAAAPEVFELTGADAIAVRETRIARTAAKSGETNGRNGFREPMVAHRAPLSATERSLQSVIAWAVPSFSASVRLEPQPLDPYRWNHLLSAVVDQRIAGLLWTAIEAGMPVTSAQRIGAATMAHDAMRIAVSLEATAYWTLDVLQAAGVDARLIKGLASARVVHRSPELRDSGDVDLLVLPRDFDRAQTALTDAGLTTELRWGAGATGFAKEQLFISPLGIEIDLHQSLNYGGRWRRLTPLLLENGVRVPEAADAPGFTTLNIEGLFVSAAISASRSDGRLGGLLDLAVISHDPRLDPGRLRDLLDSVGLGPALAPVLSKASRYFDIADAAADAVRLGRATTAHRACARIEAGESGARYLYSCLSGSPRHWAPGLRALAFPDAAHFENDPRSGGRAKRVAKQTLRLLAPSAWRTRS